MPQQDHMRPPPELRDDNLRLIFSEAELLFLDEKRKNVIFGFYAVAGVICLTFLIGVYFFATPFPAYLQDTTFDLMTVALGIIGYFGALIALTSPIIIIGLLIELRKAAKERASLIDLLIRYNRQIPPDV